MALLIGPRSLVSHGTRKASVAEEALTCKHGPPVPGSDLVAKVVPAQRFGRWSRRHISGLGPPSPSGAFTPPLMWSSLSAPFSGVLRQNSPECGGRLEVFEAGAVVWL